MTPQEESIQTLKTWLKPGDTVFCILRSVSRSGMSRTISFLTFLGNDATKPVYLDYHIARACGYKLATDERNQGLKINGCGMDMGFAVVYELGRRLFPEGFGVLGKLLSSRGEQLPIRPTSKANAARATRCGGKFYGRNGDTSGWDNDGGYALEHKWL